jgi:hypothetical protein
MNKLAEVRSERNYWYLTFNDSIKDIQEELNKLDCNYTILEDNITKLEERFEQTVTLSDLSVLEAELKEHLLNHEGLDVLTGITADDIIAWREDSERLRKALYITEENNLCTGKDLLEAVVLDCGTA